MNLSALFWYGFNTVISYPLCELLVRFISLYAKVEKKSEDSMWLYVSDNAMTFTFISWLLLNMGQQQTQKKSISSSFRNVRIFEFVFLLVFVFTFRIGQCFY